MGRQLDRLYSDLDNPENWLQYIEIDKLVHLYKETDSSQVKRETREKLLKAFHKYFMKYVALLSGITGGLIESADTRSFLSLFISSENRAFSNYNSVHKYIVSVCKPLEDVDIYNELVVMFLSLLDKFEFQPGVSFTHYITMYMRWCIKTWILDMSKDLLFDETRNTSGQSNPEFPDLHPQRESFELPKLTLGWVFDPQSPLFNHLTVYERFLLYLNFKEGLGVRQISERLGRAKDTVHTHIQRALDKCRAQYNSGILEREEK